MTKMTEFSSNGFKAVIIVTFHEVNVFKINGQLGVPSRETETINKDQMKIIELKTRISIIKNSWAHFKSRIEIKEEKPGNMKIHRNSPIYILKKLWNNTKNLIDSTAV